MRKKQNNNGDSFIALFLHSSYILIKRGIVYITHYPRLKKKRLLICILITCSIIWVLTPRVFSIIPFVTMSKTIKLINNYKSSAELMYLMEKKNGN